MRQTHIYSVEEFGSFERCNRDTQKNGNVSQQLDTKI